MISERTLYRFIDSRVLSAMNLDLPRKVRFSARKNKVHVKVDKKCRIGRDFEAFKDFMLKILKELFFGNVYPYEKQTSRNSELDNLRQLVLRNEKTMSELLTTD